jgi:leader peptidase (prepilin peptidase)/N-methyltransferase
MVQPLVVLAAALTGLVMGSFVATAAIRQARGEAFVGGRSHCDGCGAPLGFAATLPLASYVGLRGAAGCCGARIDPFHPAGELSGLFIGLAAIAAGDGVKGLLIATLGFGLLGLSLVDLRTQRLPDPLVAVVAAAALVLAALGQSSRLAEGMCAAALTFAVLEGLRRAFLHLRGRGGLGGGDVKLLSALALWLGLLTPAALALAAILGLVQVMALRPQGGRIAFGPAIALAAFAVGEGRGLFL